MAGIGPVENVVIEFPGNRFKGEIVPVIDVVGQLKELAALKEQGTLTEEEFATQKARVLRA